MGKHTLKTKGRHETGKGLSHYDWTVKCCKSVT